MPYMGIKVQAGPDVLTVIWPGACTDITLPWYAAFDLGNMIGETAFQMPKIVTDPGQDAAIAGNAIKFGRYGECVVMLFGKKITHFEWTRNVALIVAETICEKAEDIAEALQIPRRRLRVRR